MTAGGGASDLFDHAPCGLLASTPSGVVITVNDTFLEMIGTTRDEVVGHYLIERLTRGSKLFYETRFMPLLRQQGRATEVAFDMQLPDAQTLSVFVNAVIDAAPGAALGDEVIRFAVFDATVRRHYERDLLAARRAAELSEKRVRIMQAATSGFGAAESEAELASTLADAARTATDASQVSVYFVTDNRELALATPNDSLPHALSLDSPSPATEAVRLAVTVLCSDSTELARQFPASTVRLRAARIEAITAVPIVDDGTSIGVLICGFGRPRALEPTTLDVLQSLAEQSVVVRQRIRLRELVAFQALHDALTGLPNRLFLQRRLDQLLAPDRSATPSIALIFVDLDGFKAVNDKLGHQGGDRVLQEVSERLKGVVRSGDIVARLGGDEFLLVCERVDQDAVVEIAERLRVAVRQPLAGEAATLPVSASVGVIFYRDDTSRNDVTGETLIRFADEAMYESKRAGKDRYTFVQV